MAQTKPTKPTDLMPRHFADDGIKNNFSSAKITSGFSSNFDDILQGDNLNYMIDSIGKELQYLSTVVDFIVDMPINKTLKVNSNNNLEYVNLVEDVSNKANVSLNNLDVEGQAKFDDKANIDLSNTTPSQSFINMAVGWGMPVYGDGISVGNPYTVEEYGLCRIQVNNGNSASINGKTVVSTVFSSAGGNTGNDVLAPVSPGDVISGGTKTFFPLKGAN